MFAEPESEPELIYSKHNRLVVGKEPDARAVEVYIYKTEEAPEWTLEVVNDQNTSWVWDETFKTDTDANAAFEAALKQEGMDVFFGEE